MRRKRLADYKDWRIEADFTEQTDKSILPQVWVTDNEGQYFHRDSSETFGSLEEAERWCMSEGKDMIDDHIS